MASFDDDETQAPDYENHPQVDSDSDSPSPLVPECHSYNWKVKLIDGNGTIEDQTMTTKDVWKLTNRKVMVHFDEETGQPDEDSAGLFASYLGQLSGDVSLLPIDYTDWRKFANHRKEAAWTLIKSKFWFDHPETRKKYAISVLGSRCKDLKLRIWKTYKRHSMQETLDNRPNVIPDAQWKSFVEERFGEKWKKMQKRNTINQKNNVTPHACGRKSFARKRKEIFEETGKKSCRASFFITSRKKANGSFVNDVAKDRAEKLQDLMSQQPEWLIEQNAASLNDDFAMVFGKERSGRIRCLGRGPTPSMFLNRGAPRMQIQEPENTELVDQLKSQVTVLQTQVQNLSGFLQQFIAPNPTQPIGMIPNIGAITSSLPIQQTSTSLPNFSPQPNYSSLPNFSAFLSTFANFNQTNSQAMQGGENGTQHGGQLNGANHEHSSGT